MKFFKITLVLILLPLISQAVEMPQTVKALYQVSGSGTEPDPLFRDIQNNEARLDLDMQCKTVYYKWKADSSTTCSVGDGWGQGNVACLNPFNHVFGSTHYVTYKSVTMTAYCDPRGYDEKVLISLQRSCETKPELSCLDENVKNALRNINVTQRIDIDKPK